MTAVIAVTSGTAKVGKTVLSANLAHYLSEKGNRTALLVAGSSTPVLDVAPKSTWPNVINGRLPVDQAIQSNIFGLDMMVTQGHGHALGSLSTRTTDHLSNAIRDIEGYAYLVVDMAAGLTAPTVACCLAATESLLVVTAGTATLTAAYEWLVRLGQYGFKGPINMILNQVMKPALAQSVFIRFRDLAQKKLNIQVNLWGSLSFDESAQGPNVLHQPLSLSHPNSKLLREIQIIGDRLLAEQPPENQTQPLSMFWRMLIKQLQGLPVMPVKPHAGQAAAKDKTDPGIVAREIAASAEDPPEPRTDLAAALQNMTEHLAAIAAELSAIRRLMENGAGPKANVGAGGPTASETKTILDFDAFVSQQEKAR